MDRRKSKQSGTRFEYKIMHLLQNLGYYVIRSAGSHTCADLVAVEPNRILFVQCKYSGTPALSMEELVALADLSKMNETYYSLAICKGKTRGSFETFLIVWFEGKILKQKIGNEWLNL